MGSVRLPAAGGTGLPQPGVDEQRALAGPIRPDHRADLASCDLELNVTQRVDATERERDAGKREHRPRGAIASLREPPVAGAGASGGRWGERRLVRDEGFFIWKAGRPTMGRDDSAIELAQAPHQGRLLF